MLSVHPAPRSAVSDLPAPNRSVPRYCPRRAFPAYRYVPGLQPHPRRDPAGHSYKATPRPRRQPPWDPAAWRVLDDWLYGVDLFNAFFFWEAHEEWEGLWAAQPRSSPAAQTLQGLIQLAAALLKVHLGSLDGAISLSRDGLAKLAAVGRIAPEMLGLDLDATVADFHHYFRPLDQRTLPPLDAAVPRLVLLGRSDA